MRQRIPIVKVEGYAGLGALVQQNAHFAVVEFRMAGHRWEVVVENEDCELVCYAKVAGEGLEEI